MHAELLLAAALAAFAQTAPAAPSAPGLDDLSDWSLEVPPAKPPTPGQPTVTNAEGSFSQSETIRFGEQMRHGVLDQICRGININVMPGYGIDGIGFHGGIDRSIQVLPDQRLALVEQTALSFDLGRQLLSGIVQSLPVSLSISGHVDGASTVVRPLPTKNSCKEVGELVQLWKQKTVLPLKPERIAAMEVGELWKVPMDLSIGIGAGTSDQLNPSLNPSVAASVSFGTGQTGSALVTLYRLSQDKIRLRVRINHVRVHNQGGQIVEVLPAVELFAPGGGLVLKALERVVDQQISRQLVSFMGAMIGVGASQSEGQQLLMEFVLDPNKPEEMATLSKVLQGDFRTGVEMAVKMLTLQATPEASRADFEREEQKMERIFGRPANDPALDIYHGKVRSFAFILPFFVNHNHASTTADDQIVRLTPEGGQFRLYRAEKTSGTGDFNVPIKGALVKRNSLRSAQAFVFESKDGQVTPAQGVYIQQHGFLREDQGTVREEVQQINDIMALAGARGGPRNARMTVPIDDKLPAPPPPEHDFRTGQDIRHSETFHDGSILWTLIFTDRAVKQIVEASDEVIVKSLINTLDSADQALMNWVMSLPNWLGEDGKVSYDWRAFWKQFGGSQQDSQETRSRLDQLCKLANAVVMDVAYIRKAPTQSARAQALVDVMAGKGESGLEYQDILKVLVQLTDPLNLTSDLGINVSKGVKGQKDVHDHYVLKKLRPENPLLKQAGDAKNRFSQPSNLVD